MLTIRPRGRFWHARGTIKAAGKTVYLQECSTGETEEALARKWARRKETEIENDLREGRPLQARSLTFAAVVDRLTDNPNLKPRDLGFLWKLNGHFGDRAMDAIDAAGWSEFVRDVLGPGAAAGTEDRYLYVFRKVFRAAEADGARMPKIVSPRTAQVRRQAQRARWLTVETADKLVAAYPNARARVIGLTLRYQGFRTQECLQLDRRGVDIAQRTFGVGKSKNGFARTVAMHPRVFDAVSPLMGEKRRRYMLDDGSDFEPLFLNRVGEPYRDTRDEGGNPFSASHDAACAAAGVLDFTPHDWRRHWACWMLKNGTDPWTLMKLGGWTDLASIEPYIQAAAGDMGRQREALARVA